MRVAVWLEPVCAPATSASGQCVPGTALGVRCCLWRETWWTRER